MKALMMTALAAGFLMMVGQASAADESALAQKSGCMACHSVDKKVIGPAYKDVAAKYKGQKDAEAKLIEKVKKGGSGVWGPIPMSANSPQVKDEDIKKLVEWVLSM
ncbi:MAG: c-type cytochrome [Methylobacillus sp.]|jgi:cytochrome c|nr:c-type cytochrome [Methylobacillus sp.]